MKAAGITIRKLTILRDQLQAERNAISASIDYQERQIQENLNLGHSLSCVDRVKALKAERSRIDTALEKVKPALVSLTELYANAWLDLPAENVAAVVRKGRPQ